jgi:pectin methylesterase-like acyl-CoA thioesterase
LLKYLLLLLLPLNIFFHFGQLNGTYTIGGLNPNYSTLTSAVNSLISNGINGPVVFNIRNGVYQERVTIPQITGANSLNTITIR